ncbi:Aldo/keto reductase [Corynespora cassiicola Philippines]|uniref:Aldo/keto reductase n=1 Tax=Corynespora cassiicola Philippines TaxID=1448308 RepID=A0A2T2NN68_CORCC|nr:Aldo/keto reductase [Corynespora cassiicola Philippines]
MSFFASPPKPKTALGWHRVLSPTAAVKVSPFALGGISFGNSWSELFGKSEDPFTLLDTFYELGGNFIDTANNYNSGDSEKIIGEWMEKRGVRDQMVIATKYGSGYRSHNRENEPLQSNFTGASAKSLHVSVRNSLKSLRTDYIDILYLHWWEFQASVEEVMLHLHALVMAKQVLYLGISDTPAWVVVKANEFARRNGLTPFSVYQGRWNAAFRDMESEIIPMCEDQGMAIVSWASLGGGMLTTAEQRRKNAEDPNAPKFPYGDNKEDIQVSEVIERLADKKKVSFQALTLAYLFHQSTYVFPIVGVQNVDHVKALPDAVNVKLSQEEIDEIHGAVAFNPLFPNTFLFGDKYNTKLTSADQIHLQMSTWINAPPKPLPYQPQE